MRKECEYLATCPVFARFKMEGLANFWIERYCKGAKQDMCERKKIALQGLSAPETMLPNGKHLRSE
jgi:hypothetical protein